MLKSSLSRDRFAVLRWSAAALIFGSLNISQAGALKSPETALDRYVAKPDPTFSWKIVRQEKLPGGTRFVIDMKSQTWRKPNEVNRTVWQHYVTIVKPDKPTSNVAFLFIAGGSNGGPPPEKLDPLIGRIALETKGIVCELKQVPNETLIFHNDGHKRTEDDLIAYTYDQFLKGGDEEWPARLPMVKSAVRAMDCIQKVLASKEGGETKVEKFVVSGGSKRGWTTWCTAAVDPRVVAIAPASIDCLNNGPSMRHHVAVYGFYTRAVGDYVRHKIVRQPDNPRMKLLHEIEDPYEYRARLTMPKYVVEAAGDQYFPPDNSQFYFEELPGEKFLHYVPNTDHGLRGSDARDGIAAFYYTVANNLPRPKLTWTFENDGSIHVRTSSTPKSVTLWQANNPEARDFRLMTIGKAYKPTTLNDEGGGVYVGKIEKPERGWTASFVELVFDVGAPTLFKVSTAVRITPDTLPHQDVDPRKAPLEMPTARSRD